MANVSIISLGCDKNLVDSEVMVGLLKERGHTICEEDGADVVIINSCAFIEDALEESVNTIIEMGEMKESGAVGGIIVAGCLAERYKKNVFDQLPEVDIIVGTSAYEDIVEAVGTIVTPTDRVKCEFFTDISAKCNEEKCLKRENSVVGGYYAYLKIAEGCDNHCTYCVIPSLRGSYRSRTMDSLVKEAQELAFRGAREIILVAQDTSVYGLDIYGKIMLPELLNKISAIENVEWVRLLYVYPENVTEDLIQTIASNSKICNYIDMPIQHISDSVLKSMGRKVKGADIERILSDLREKIDGVVIRTSLITGFPGESEENFAELLEFITREKLDRVGVFAFSKEEGTAAYLLKNQVDKKTRTKRKNALMKAQKNVAEQAAKSHIGRTLRVIVEGKADDIYICRSYMDAPNVDGYVFLDYDGELLSGDFVDVKVIEARGYDLIGEIFDSEDA